MNEFNITIGKNIRKLREKKGYTREKLAEMADINDKFLYEIETGRKGLSVQKMYSISRSLGVTMDLLVSGEQDNSECEMIMVLLNAFSRDELKCIEDIIRSISEMKNSNHEK